jgi:ribosomal-protein-serine acetyltransferase
LDTSINPSRKIKLISGGGNFFLRPYQLEDAPAIYAAVDLSRHELSPWMDWCNPDYSIQDTVNWLEGLPRAWNQRQIYGFAAFDAATEEFLGGCSLNHINWAYRLANLAYWVRTDRTSEGIATGSALLVAQFGLDELGLRRIEIVVAVDNKASRRVAEKTGAKFEGILRNRIKIGAENYDAAMYSLVPVDFADP